MYEMQQNITANIKHLAEVCFLIDKEDLREKVNQCILNLRIQITPKLSEKDDLILRLKKY